MTAEEIELEKFLNHVAQQSDWSRVGYWRLGVYEHNPQLLLLANRVIDPNGDDPFGSWTCFFMEHHNAVELAAHLIWHARHLQWGAGVPMEKAHRDTFNLLFERLLALNEQHYPNHADRETQP